uniref:Taste receptor type 2 n=1 Tax=Pelusios castaneus TaxID=367368 RepID=A0A8C8S0S0_9SAUR
RCWLCFPRPFSFWEPIRMAGGDDGALGADFFFSLVILAVESVIGIGGNGVIFAVNLANWVMSRRLSSCEMILIFLSLSRFCLQSWVLVGFICKTFYPAIYDKENVLWFAAWLSVLYCAKIANFTQPLFLWLKRKISSLLPKLMVGSSLFSLVNSVPFLWNTYNVYSNNSMANTTEQRVLKDSNFFPLLFLCSIGLCLPLIVFVASTVMLIISLWRHTRKMQNNEPGFMDPSMEAHLGAIKSIFSFLILYIFYFVALLILLSNILANNIGDIICRVMMAAYPMGHSIILILGNPKLKQARILHCARTHSFPTRCEIYTCCSPKVL